MSAVHSTAMVHPQAEIDSGVEIGPGAVIGPEVRIGAGCRIGAYVVMEGRVTLGRENRIFHHAVLGTPPQDFKYQGGPTEVVVGDRNILREFVTVHRGTEHGGGITRIGSDAYLMAYVHVGHDNLIGDGVVLTNAVQLGGHVRVDEWAAVGGCAAVHQFVRVGAHAFVGGGAIVLMDVAPFCKAAGNPARLAGLNSVGLRRRGFGDEKLKLLRRAYRLAFGSKLLCKEAAERIEQEIVPLCPEAARLAEFLRASRRGITR